MMISATGYAIWMVSLALTSIALKSESISNNLSYTAVCVIVVVSSIIVGISASLCWVAQGKYLSDCTLACMEKKGMY